jgi:hypothetical protein
MDDAIRRHYKDRIETNRVQLSLVKKNLYLTATARLPVFLGTITFNILLAIVGKWNFHFGFAGGVVCFVHYFQVLGLINPGKSSDNFEAGIKDDELSFSYQLREEIAQNMNATFLMRKMGITV